MNFVKKMVAGCLASTLLLGLVPMNIQAASGWQWENNSWYYYNPDGSKASGWVLVDNNWFYLENDGKMRTSSWVASTEADWYWVGAGGYMQYESWIDYYGEKYYVKENGLMARNEAIVVGNKKYTFSDNGVLLKEEAFEGKNGWVESNGQYYYYKAGEKQKGWQQINGKTYYLGGKDYHMYYGVNVIDGKTYEFTNNGQLIGEVDTDYEDQYDSKDYATEKQLLVNEMNQKREDLRLDDLTFISKNGLDKAAFVRAHELKDEYSDLRPDGSSIEDLLDELDVDYDYVEEYYFKASSTAKALSEISLDKALARAIKDKEFDTVAVGVVKSNNTYIWEILLVDSGSSGNSSTDKADGDQQDIIDYINDYRYEANRDELEFDSALSDAAEEWAYQLATGNEDYKDLDDLLWDFDIDYDSYANVVSASRVNDFYDMVDAWYKSSSSKTILNHRSASSIGVGIYEYRSRVYVAVIVTDQSSSNSVSDMKEELLDLINEYRDEEGVGSLKLATGSWEKAVNDRVHELAVNEGDEDELTSLRSFLKKYGITYSSSKMVEFNTYSCEDAQEAFDDLYRYDYDDELANEKYTRVAIGFEEKAGDSYWTIFLY